MDDQRLHVGHVRQQREQVQVVDEDTRRVLAALDVEGEDGAGAVREVLLVQLVVAAPLDGRVRDGLDLRHGLQVLDNLQRVLHVALDAQRQGLGALQQQERGERGQGGTGVAQQDGADAGHEGGSTKGLVEVQTVVGGIRLGQGRELARHLSPVEVAAFHDDTTQRGAVAADELGRGLDHDVGAVLQRAEQVRGGEGVVDDHRQMMLVGDCGDGLEVGQVGVWIAEGLEVDELGVLLDGVLEVLRNLRIDESGGDAVARQRVLEQVEGAAVDVLGGDDVVTGLGDVAHGVLDGRGARGDRDAGGAAFKGGDAILEHALGGVGQTAVDVTRVGESEAGLGVVEVVEDVAGGRVDRHCAGVGGRVGLLLADVQLQGFKTVLLVGFGHGGCSFSHVGMLWFPCLSCRHPSAVSSVWRGVGLDHRAHGCGIASPALSRLPITL